MPFRNPNNPGIGATPGNAPTPSPQLNQAAQQAANPPTAPERSKKDIAIKSTKWTAGLVLSAALVTPTLLGIRGCVQESDTPYNPFTSSSLTAFSNAVLDSYKGGAETAAYAVGCGISKASGQKCPSRQP